MCVVHNFKGPQGSPSKPKPEDPRGVPLMAFPRVESPLETLSAQVQYSGFSRQSLEAAGSLSGKAANHSSSGNGTQLSPPSDNENLGMSLAIQWLRLRLLIQKVWVQSLVRELRFHVPLVAKYTKA